tara:strand:- start:112 stop:507 length:396 start_codon:yes stop_codon:yes gene_type:complete
MSSQFEDLKILVVEDETEARSMLCNMLAELGASQVFEAADGREAVEFIDSRFDFINLIMCDWNMPGMTGVELLRQLRKIDPSLPFLMITGRSDEDSVLEAKSSGVTAYIRKPFSSKQLEAKLRIILYKMAA